MIIVNPVARPKQLNKEIVKLSTLRGKTVGVFNNGWASWGLILSEIERILVDKYESKEVKIWNIPLASEAPQELIDDAVKVCDLCIVGLGN
jgi:hypothetical protein